MCLAMAVAWSFGAFSCGWNGIGKRHVFVSSGVRHGGADGRLAGFDLHAQRETDVFVHQRTTPWAPETTETMSCHGIYVKEITRSQCASEYNRLIIIIELVISCFRLTSSPFSLTSPSPKSAAAVHGPSPVSHASAISHSSAVSSWSASSSTAETSRRSAAAGSRGLRHVDWLLMVDAASMARWSATHCGSELCGSRQIRRSESLMPLGCKWSQPSPLLRAGVVEIGGNILEDRVLLSRSN